MARRKNELRSLYDQYPTFIDFSADDRCKQYSQKWLIHWYAEAENVENKGYRYKDWFRAILNWERMNAEKPKNLQRPAPVAATIVPVIGKVLNCQQCGIPWNSDCFALGHRKEQI